SRLRRGGSRSWRSSRPSWGGLCGQATPLKRGTPPSGESGFYGDQRPTPRERGTPASGVNLLYYTAQLFGSGGWARTSAWGWPPRRAAWNMAVGSPWANLRWVASTKSVGRVASKARHRRGWALRVGGWGLGWSESLAGRATSDQAW